MSGSEIVGIDLGTTNSLVAVFTDDGPRLVPNGLGQYLTPSAVGLDDAGGLLVGQPAKDRLFTHPGITTARFKRYMGSSFETHLDSKNGGTYRAEELSALILRSLKSDAEAYLGRPVNEAVISVPAYFNNVQRQATVTAAKLAGLKVNRLINEPTAAALAYGIQSEEDQNAFLVVDLGGGTFDVSILEKFSGILEVRASAGDAFLGGEDFTDLLAAHLQKQLGLAEREVLVPEDMARLRACADRIKHALSTSEQASVAFVHDGTEKPLTVTREQFDGLIQPVLDKMRLPVQRVISDAGMRGDQLARIILVGGATRTPAVHALVTRLFKRFPEHELDPDHVVAMGAAVQAGLAMRHEALDDVVMTDVSPFTLGYEVSVQVGENQYEHGHFESLIDRNTVVPVSRSQVISALVPGQKEIELRIYQGESPFTAENVCIGQLRIPVPYNRKEREAVEVRYTLDTSGLLEVIATVMSTNKTFRVVIEREAGSLSKEEIEKRLKSLSRLKIHPRELQENVAMKARLGAVYANFLGDKRDYVAGLIHAFEQALYSQDERLIAQTRAELASRLDELENLDVF